MTDSDDVPGVFSTRHDWDADDSVCLTVVRAVSAVTGKDPTEIDPLYEFVDPDALEELLQSLRSAEGARGERSVTFRFDGCTVFISAEGELRISEADAETGG